MIISINIFDWNIFINPNNTIFWFDYSGLLEDEMDINQYLSTYNASYIIICLNISNACNLRCSYCFIVEHFLKVHKEYTFTKGKQKFDKIKER